MRDFTNFKIFLLSCVALLTSVGASAQSFQVSGEATFEDGKGALPISTVLENGTCNGVVAESIYPTDIKR